MHACRHTHTHTQAHTRKRTRACTHTHTRMHIHTHRSQVNSRQTSVLKICYIIPCSNYTYIHKCGPATQKGTNACVRTQSPRGQNVSWRMIQLTVDTLFVCLLSVLLKCLLRITMHLFLRVQQPPGLPTASLILMFYVC